MADVPIGKIEPRFQWQANVQTNTDSVQSSMEVQVSSRSAMPVRYDDPATIHEQTGQDTHHATMTELPRAPIPLHCRQTYPQIRRAYRRYRGEGHHVW